MRISRKTKHKYHFLARLLYLFILRDKLRSIIKANIHNIKREQQERKNINCKFVIIHSECVIIFFYFCIIIIMQLLYGKLRKISNLKSIFLMGE